MYNIEEAHKIKTIITVNFRDFPKKFEELKFCNYSGATMLELPIRSDLKEGVYTAKSNFWNVFTPTMAHMMEGSANTIH